MENLLSSISSPIHRRILLVCALPQWFDITLLSTLLDARQEQERTNPDGIIGYPFVCPIEEPSEGFELEKPIQNELLLELQRNPNAFADTMSDIELCFNSWINRGQLGNLKQALARLRPIASAESIYYNQLDCYQGCLYNEFERYEAAEEIFNRLLSKNDLPRNLRAQTFMALGFNYESRNLFDQAIDAHKECGRIYAELNDRSGQAKALTHQGIIVHRLAEYDQARALFAQGLELAQEVGNLSLQGQALNGLGYTAKEQGVWALAQDYYHQSLDIWIELEHVKLQSLIHNNLGEIEHLFGTWTKAEYNYNQALRIARNQEHQDKREIADMYFNLGFLLHTQEKFQPAEAYYNQALSLAQEADDQFVLSQIYYRLGDLWRVRGQTAQAKIAYANAIEAIEQVRNDTEQPDTRISVLGIRLHVYQAMVLLCLQLEEPDKALSYVERAKSRAFLDMLSELESEKVLPTASPFTADEIQAHLSDDEVLIEFFTTGAAGPHKDLFANIPAENQKLRAYLAPPEKVVIFVVTPKRVDVFEPNVKMHQIQAHYFNQEQKDGRLLSIHSEGTLPPMQRWHVLDKQLFEEIRPLLKDKQHLYLIPHDIFHYFPLHALAPNGLTHGLAHEEKAVTISYAPSASILLKTEHSPLPEDSLRTCLAIGVDKDRLTHSEAEASRIAEYFSGTTLLGKSATRSAVRQHLGDYRIIHFSCHGHFLGTQPMESGLTLYDDILTASDILRSAPLNADIVTLSACETGLNKLAHGDELMGLTRAFLGAGTRSLLATLWKVAEIPTRIFMEYFYGDWEEGNSCAAAFASAQNHLRTMSIDTLRVQLGQYGLSTEDVDTHLSAFSSRLSGEHPFDHPYYWGAFLLIGNVR